MSVPKKAFWTIAMDILADMQEQYGLAYAGVPDDPFEARHIAKHTNIFFPVCESAYTDSLIGFHPNPRMGVGYMWRTYVCYIGAYLGEI